MKENEKSVEFFQFFSQKKFCPPSNMFGLKFQLNFVGLRSRKIHQFFCLFFRSKKSIRAHGNVARKKICRRRRWALRYVHMLHRLIDWLVHFAWLISIDRLIDWWIYVVWLIFDWLIGAFRMTDIDWLIDWWIYVVWLIFDWLIDWLVRFVWLISIDWLIDCFFAVMKKVSAQPARQGTIFFFIFRNYSEMSDLFPVFFLKFFSPYAARRYDIHRAARRWSWRPTRSVHFRFSPPNFFCSLRFFHSKFPIILFFFHENLLKSSTDLHKKHVFIRKLGCFFLAGEFLQLLTIDVSSSCFHRVFRRRCLLPSQSKRREELQQQPRSSPGITDVAPVHWCSQRHAVQQCETRPCF